ncbi:MAG: ATP-binding cassette domain-containing protein [Candidatus Lokiarchaeota archaeon]|nr:ATP-binding cassette domain-containing protein [Candidatus Lokiarchaeota archaeon]
MTTQIEPQQRQFDDATDYMFSGLRKHPGVIAGATILTVISSVLVTLPMTIVGQAIDELTVNGFTATFVNYCWIIVGLGLAYMVLYFVVGYSWARVTLAWERDARQDFFDMLQENSMTFHDEIDSKRLLSVAMQDINWVRMSLNPALRNIVFGISSFLVTTFLVFRVDRSFTLFSLFGFPAHGLTLIMIVGFPLYLAFAYRYANNVEPVRRKRAEKMEDLTSSSQEVFRGIEVVRSFGKEDWEAEKFEEETTEYEHLVAREGRLAAFYIPSLILTGMTTLAFIYGGFAVLSGILSIGNLTQVIGLLVSLQGFNFMLPRMLLALRGGYVNAGRIVNLINWEDPMIESEESSEDIDWNGDIVFDDVSFSYNANNSNGSAMALKKLSIQIPRESRVAIIGGPGGGKSTILKLILRLYDPTQGTVRIGGVDLSNIRTADVRDHVGLVEQDIFLFRMTVKENIAFGRPEATDEEIIQAAKRAQAHEFIEKLPKGYDSMVGEKGMTLSGGQRQRLAIARAIIQDPQILLLDDSASAIDAQTEFQLRQALDEVMKGRTSITVTQRLRTLLESDMVIIVDKGELVAAGCHDELLRTSEHYRKIFERLPGAEQFLTAAAKQGGVA